eukprot:TRINITY_DN8175_c0_g2_i1.p1 TRINITY_DN8175_c0_g2~~TRINITY_DN8175_c0_g2_i1.p1  ORF type:complete len:154 (-),score=15.35 TRINITY_DN8175_c0_g2_i1:179-640(-)
MLLALECINNHGALACPGSLQLLVASANGSDCVQLLVAVMEAGSTAGLMASMARMASLARMAQGAHTADPMARMARMVLAARMVHMAHTVQATGVFAGVTVDVAGRPRGTNGNAYASASGGGAIIVEQRAVRSDILGRRQRNRCDGRENEGGA